MIIISRAAQTRINQALINAQTAQSMLVETIKTVADALEVPKHFIYDPKEGAFKEPAPRDKATEGESGTGNQ